VGAESPQYRSAEVVVDVGCAGWHSGGRHDLPMARLTNVMDEVRRDPSRLAGASLIVLGMRSGEGLPADQMLLELRRHLPHVSVFVCAESTNDIRFALPKLAWAGADEVLALSTGSDWRYLQDLVRRRMVNPIPERAIRLLATQYPAGDGRNVLLWGLRTGFRPRSEGDAKRFFGRDVKTINARLDAIDAPEIGCVLRYGVLFHAKEQSVRALGTMTVIARRLGLCSARALWERRRTAARQVNRGLPGRAQVHAILERLWPKRSSSDRTT